MDKKKDAGYRIIDHTADIGLEATGESLDKAFENAAVGMFAILSGSSEIHPEQEMEIRVEAEDIEGLLVEFLSELLYLYEVEGMLFSKFMVRIHEKNRKLYLDAKVWGESYNPEKHNYPTEIKAVTYHMLKVEKNPPLVRVIFDL